MEVCLKQIINSSHQNRTIPTLSSIAGCSQSFERTSLKNKYLNPKDFANLKQMSVVSGLSMKIYHRLLTTYHHQTGKELIPRIMIWCALNLWKC